MDKSIMGLIIDLILSLFVKKKDAVEVPKVIPEAEAPKETEQPSIDWTNPSCLISKHFTVKEACWLPSWKVMHIPSDQEKENILKQASKMDLIRDFLGVPINTHDWIRPILNNPESEHHGQDYNAFEKGAKNSAHKVGLATDYDAKGLSCDDVRAKLEPKLEEWQIRMEKMPGGNWVHNDCAPVITSRYFNP